MSAPDEIRVLDHGFVHFVEGLGYDRAVVQAARVCYKSEGLGDAAKDRKLVAYLLAHKHGTPFEHAVLKFHVKAPLFVARQWFRHRMASYNEVSGRYAEAKDEFYMPAKWRAQDAKVNKQGSVDGALEHDVHTGQLLSICNAAMKTYRDLLAAGVAKEMARIALPVNLYTEWYWTVNARSLMNFLELRSEQHAQWEMRQFSNALWKLWVPRMPWTAAAFLAGLDLIRYASSDGLPGPCHGDLHEAAQA